LAKNNSSLKWRTVIKNLNDLKTYKKNPRKLSPEKKEILKASLNKYGLPEIPVIDTDGTLVAGNQRVTILREMGLVSIPVSVPNRKLTKEEIEEYNLISNTHAGTWDIELLKAIDIQVLQDIGFDDIDLDKIIGAVESDKDPDAVPDVPIQSFQIIITCRDKKDQTKIYSKLSTEGYKLEIKNDRWVAWGK